MKRKLRSDEITRREFLRIGLASAVGLTAADHTRKLTPIAATVMLDDMAYWQRVKNLRAGNLIGYWRLNEGSGTTAADSSDNGYDGKLIGVTGGEVGIGDGVTCMGFDGTDDLIDVFSSGLANTFNGNAGTLMVWVKVRSLETWTDGQLRRAFYLAANDDNRIIVQKSNSADQFAMMYIAGGITSSVAVNQLNDTEWMCWCLTWDATADEAKVYKNGSQIGDTQTGLGTWAGIPGITVTGAGSLKPTFVWSGWLAHVALWNTALTAEEIAPLGQGTGSSAAVTTDFYVNGETGSDATGNGTLDAPWATIHQALTSVPDMAACMIHVAAGTYVEDSGNGYLDIHRMFLDWVTVRADGEVIVTDTGTGDFSVRFRGCQKVEFDGVVFAPTVIPPTGTIDVSGADTSLRLVKCTVYSRNAGLYYSYPHANVSVNLDSCTFLPAAGVSGTAQAVFCKPGNNGGIMLTLLNCTMVGQSARPSEATVDLGNVAGGINQTVEILVDGGAFTGTNNYALHCAGGNLIVNGGTFSSAGAPALVWGMDGPTDLITTGKGSNFTATSRNSHALMVGQGTRNIAISYATINAGDYGIVCEGDGNTFDHVRVNPGTLSAVLLKGCSNVSVTYCTLIASRSGQACVDMVLLDNKRVSHITLIDNVLAPISAADCLYWKDNTVDAGGGVCDRNAYDYSSSSGNVGDVRGVTDIISLAELQAAWSGYDVPGNDLNSTVAYVFRPAG